MPFYPLMRKLPKFNLFKVCSEKTICFVGHLLNEGIKAGL